MSLTEVEFGQKMTFIGVSVAPTYMRVPPIDSSCSCESRGCFKFQKSLQLYKYRNIPAEVSSSLNNEAQLGHAGDKTEFQKTQKR